MTLFEGAGIVLVTPFRESGEANYEKLEEIVEEQITDGTDAIIAYGTTGEVSTITRKEYLEVIEYICRVTKKRIPVVARADPNCTETAVYLFTEAEEKGANGLLPVSPYYNRATQKGLMAHFTAAADAVKIPVILYNIPSRTSVATKPGTIVALCKDVDNVVGVKEASGNFSTIATLTDLSDGKMDLYSGNDDQIIPPLSLGGKGIISVLSNMAPRQTHDICASCFVGDVKAGTSLQLKAIPLITEFFSEVNPTPVKAAMNMMGKDMGPLRVSLTEMESRSQEEFRKTMADYGIL